jgi:hypothetical protein
MLKGPLARGEINPAAVFKIGRMGSVLVTINLAVDYLFKIHFSETSERSISIELVES